MNNSSKNISTNIKDDSNKNIDEFIKKMYPRIKQGKELYESTSAYIKSATLMTKILNVSLMSVLIFIFTYVKFNLGLSIFFAIILFLMIFIENKMYAVCFIIIYIITIVKIFQDINKYIGNPVPETDIIKNKVPYDCTSGALIVASSTLPQELNGGLFSYSFWLYVNGNNNNINNGVNWNSYRHKEWKSIFYRGTPIDNNGDISSLLQYPGFWLTPVFNNLIIVFQNGNVVERFEIDNIEFNKWNNFAVVIESKSVQIYINGYLDRTFNLSQNIRIMNNYNLYITNDAKISQNNKPGFAGSLAQLICYNYALSPTDVLNSYRFYNKVVEKYKFNVDSDSKYKYEIPSLITNSDNKLCNKDEI
jgi:hypothetical protein